MNLMVRVPAGIEKTSTVPFSLSYLGWKPHEKIRDFVHETITSRQPKFIGGMPILAHGTTSYDCDLSFHKSEEEQNFQNWTGHFGRFIFSVSLYNNS
jgi:hypothetical protein